jgi:2-polyprenyl-3-methyl-5-hydroxy-6-metoxy-1,4-benzoquinol methylase
MMNLSQRSTLPELMDDPSTSAEEYTRCLRDLAAVNRVTLTHHPTLHWLARATHGLPPDRPVAILDVACGEGDLLRAIHRWAERRRLPVRLEGLDLNPRSAIAAAAQTPPGMAIAWRTGDVFDHAPDPAPDFIVTSQFTHHLSDADVVRFLRWLEAHAARGWFIADLHRNAFAYHGFGLLATVMRWHPIVRHDGMVSVARSFRRAEWRRLLAEAGVPGELRWHLAFRWCVGRLR